MKSLTPQQTLKMFKTVLKEAAKTFGTTPEKVNIYQFQMVSNGRVTARKVYQLGGYGTLKSWAVGGKGAKNTAVSETVKVLERLAKGAA